MTALGWLSRSATDVPPGDAWLGPRERDVLAGLSIAPRRDSWRLGRFTAKAAVAAWLGVAAEAVEILAAEDGVPEAWLGEERAPVALSISHRAGRGIAVVGPPACAVGCDLEAIEPRSGAFVREWLAEAEREYVAAGDAAQRANLVWTAKEAAAKTRREGLRLDVRRMVARPEAGGPGWAPLAVAGDGVTTRGWWRAEPGWVIAVTSEPPGPAPRAL